MQASGPCCDSPQENAQVYLYPVHMHGQWLSSLTGALQGVFLPLASTLQLLWGLEFTWYIGILALISKGQ